MPITGPIKIQAVTSKITMKAPTPVLRIFNADLAMAFYVDFMGFIIDWEHRFEPGMPLYLQVSHGSCVLHLSEHFGDSTPGSRIRIETSDLNIYLSQLRSKEYVHCRPGEATLQPWGSLEIDLTDPCGNRLTLYETIRESD